MNEPNQPSKSDILAARNRIKQWLPPSFAKDIDAGLLDGWSLYNRAMADIMRERTDAEGE